MLAVAPRPPPVFLPGEPQGRRSLVGCRLWGHTESDATDDLAAAAVALSRPAGSTRQNVSPGICPTSSKPVVGPTKYFEQLRTKMQHKHQIVIVLFPILFLQLAIGSIWDELQPRLPNWRGVT